MFKQIGLKMESLSKGIVYGGFLIALYYNSHKLMVKWWQREDYTYCYLIPFVVLYLLWKKREAIECIPSRPSWAGLVPLVFGLALFWLGELGGEYYTIYLSSWFVLLGLCWMDMGWRKLKVILLPVGFILTMFPMPNFIYFNLSLKLKLISSRFGVWVLQVVGKTAYQEGNVIDLGFTKLQVVDACNGLRYLFPLIVLAILVAYFYRSVWWKKVLVVFSAIPLSIFVNGLRIASVGLLYSVWGVQVAEGFFHDFSGWAIFMISIGILLLEVWVLDLLIPHRQNDANMATNPLTRGRESDSEGRSSTSSKVSWWAFASTPRFLAALLLMGATAATAQTVDFREATPISRSLKQFPLRVGQWVGQPEAMEKKVIDKLKFSDYIIADYLNGDGKVVNFYTAYYENQRKGESIHSPSSCLPGGGWVFHEAGQIILPVRGIAGKPVPVKRAVIQKGESKQLSYYWFPMRGRVATNIWEMKLFNFWDALTQQRTDGALVRLITPVYSGEAVEKAEARLQAFVGDIVPVLDDFLPN
jgi:exosortase D (VPLPA-CTERM-specific)